MGNSVNIDIETYSEVNLQHAGLHKYVSHPSFEILIVAYKINGGKTRVVDLTKEPFPPELEKLLLDDDTTIWAWNCQFERVCFQKYFHRKFSSKNWKCSMVRAAMASLPLKLGACALAIKTYVQKDVKGFGYIKKFCVPVVPDRKNDYRDRNYPEDFPEDWAGFVKYCGTDVDTEFAIAEKINTLPIFSDYEHEVYTLDQKINDRGVRIDMDLVRNAVQMDLTFRERVIKEVSELTGIVKPTSVKQLAKWLSEEMDEEILSVNKDVVPGILKRTDSELVKQVLGMRAMLSKSSVKKYSRMGLAIMPDQRVRGMLQYYGAPRTGRFAGRMIQLHNLPKNSMKDADLDRVRNMVLSGDLETLEMFYENVPDILSQLLRTAFIPTPGNKFLAADYSAIEARVLAWLAGEKWRLEVFAGDGKIYEASASRMFKIPLEKVTSSDRDSGKVAELALGFGGSVGAIATMDKAGKISVNMRQQIVDAWRLANPKIMQAWYEVNALAFSTVASGKTNTWNHGITFSKANGNMYIALPSGRKLVYLRVRVVSGKYGDVIGYEGQNQSTKNGSTAWGVQDTYGGKLIENIVQAIARDLLVDAMLRMDKAGLDIVMHVHDEALLEVALKGVENAKKIVESIMTTAPAWAKGLPLAVKMSVLDYYQKD